MTRATWLAGWMAMTMAAGAQGDGVEAILREVNLLKVEKLSAYLEKHAEADDADRGRDELTMAHLEVGQATEALALMRARYDRLAKADDPNLQEIFGSVVHPFVATSAAQGRKDEARALLEQVRKDFAPHPMAKRIGQFVDQMASMLDRPGPGDTLEIAFTSTDGREISLEGLKGKVVLVDFWATWCGPCIEEMPNVISTYAKYKDQGFEIVAISLDRTRKALDDYLAEHPEMTWPQQFDGKGWQTGLVEKYKIEGIPATFLVGKDGVIKYTDLRGEALGRAVAELLKAE